MAGAYPVYEKGPLTFTVNSAVVGGKLIAVDGTTGKVKIAGAADTKILGVSMIDARPYNAAEVYPTTAYGAQNVDFSVPQDEVSVAFFGVFELEAAGAIAFGDSVEPAANGTVALHSTGAVVGRCVSSAGIASGEKGLILLTLLGNTAP